MIYTQEQLEAMSDEQLNEIANQARFSSRRYGFYPCHDWNYTGILIDDLNKNSSCIFLDIYIDDASFIPVNGNYDDRITVSGGSVQRSVVIVYILVEQSK